ncbi:unnamed protein product [Orchesella dallaii]|uniref:Uncharacterized protein n=1 Tax=Orchesella dallaii TaxID=48710 RepID=A0ABP1RYZ9_9HEXA
MKSSFVILSMAVLLLCSTAFVNGAGREKYVEACTNICGDGQQKIHECCRQHGYKQGRCVGLDKGSGTGDVYCLPY